MPYSSFLRCSSSMAAMTFLYVPSPRRLSVASSSPSRDMAGMKFFTLSISSANCSSISVELVKHKNSQSGCFSHSLMMSAFRISGSPPVYM